MRGQPLVSVVVTTRNGGEEMRIKRGKGSWPFVSVVVPILNSKRTLRECLEAIGEQEYAGKVEVVVADGGSTDGSRELAKSFGARVVANRLKTGEAGKAVGARQAKGEILAFVDSDNILPEKNWLVRMVEPFLVEENLVASEPLYFTYRRKDHWLTRYFAMLGMGDPLNLFVGNYDRYSLVTDRWTDLPVNTEDKGDYLLVRLTAEKMPTIGANGFLIQRRELERYPVKDYLFDIDVLKFLSRGAGVRVAKVKTGVVHLFSGDMGSFVRKQQRRIRDYLFFQRRGVRAKEKDRAGLIWGGVKFVVATLLVVPLVVQMGLGWWRRKDAAWLFHPLACWLTLWAYGFETVRFWFHPGEFDRSKWRQ